MSRHGSAFVGALGGVAAVVAAIVALASPSNPAAVVGVVVGVGLFCGLAVAGGAAGLSAVVKAPWSPWRAAPLGVPVALASMTLLGLQGLRMVTSLNLAIVIAMTLLASYLLWPRRA
ncbi:MAG: hypothetical protein NZ518_09390 [Dehalococcoidia bacterium]|nr:hypothetical protein [Dehalococcoidia bacterium]